MLSEGAWAVSAAADDFSEHPGTSCRWRISRLCVNRNSTAGNTAVVLARPRARCPAPVGAAHTGGKAASPIRGDIQGVLPLDHFCILFLREKDVPAPA